MNNTSPNHNLTPEEVLRALHIDSGRVDAQFSDDLWRSVSSRLDQHQHSGLSSLIFNLFYMPKKQVYAIGASLALLTIAGGIGGFAILNNQTGQRDAASDRILAELFNSRESQPARSGGGATTMAADQSEKMSFLRLPGTFYNYTKNRISQGSAYSQCKDIAFMHPAGSGVTESWSYSGDEGYYFKTVVRDGQKHIVEYSLSNDKRSITYAGGSYAIENDAPMIAYLREGVVDDAAKSEETSDSVVVDEAITMPAPEPLPAPVDPDEQDIKNFIPEGAKLNEVTEDGVTYYVATWQDKFNCTVNNPQTVVYRMWSPKDEKSFTIVRDEQYLGSVNESNLISRQQILEREEKKEGIKLADVKSNFTYDLGVELRQYDNTDIGQEGYRAQVKSVLANINRPIMLVNLDERKVSGVVSRKLTELQDAPNAYLADRAYYVPGAVGDRMYNEYVSNRQEWWNTIPLVGFDQYTEENGKYEYFHVEMFQAGANMRELKSLDSDAKKLGLKPLQLGDETVTAHVYERAWGMSTGAAEATSKPEFVEIMYIFDYAGNKYYIQMNTKAMPELTVYNVQDSAAELVKGLL